MEDHIYVFNVVINCSKFSPFKNKITNQECRG